MGLIALLASFLPSDFKPELKSIPENRNSSQFENATINAYDGAEDLLYRLSSPVIHYLPDAGFEFEQPEFIYQTSSAEPLNLSAEMGYMANNSPLIALLGDVSILRHNPKNDIPEYLYTSNATIDLNRKKAYTEEKATFRQYEQTTEGTGMIVDLERQTIKLKSNIRVLNAP